MTSSEERLRILRMIEEGRISPEDGLKLMDAMEDGEASSSTQKASSGKVEARWFRVQVSNIDSGKITVNIRLPLNVVSTGIKMGARFAPEMQELDIKGILGLVKSGETGHVLSVEDEEDRERVDVFIE